MMNACEICGLETENRRFCSMSCYGVWRRGKQFRKRLVEQESRTCPTCGSQFVVRRTKTTRFCSRRCYWEAPRPPRPESVREKISKTNRVQRAAGRVFFSKETLVKSSKVRAERRALGMYKYGGNWRGGRSFEEYPEAFSFQRKEAIRNRDHRTCQICGRHESQNGGEALSVHHIDGNKKNCEPSNLVALCRACHSRTYGRITNERWRGALANRTIGFENVNGKLFLTGVGSCLALTQPISQ